jgi:hypothetical protein
MVYTKLLEFMFININHIKILQVIDGEHLESSKKENAS